VVWVPQKDGREVDVPAATRVIHDPRTVHFWDARGSTMRMYQRVLSTPGDAWDIYLLYGPGVRWDGELPPEPDFWMHQLRHAPGPILDPNVFAARAESILAAH